MTEDAVGIIVLAKDRIVLEQNHMISQWFPRGLQMSRDASVASANAERGERLVDDCIDEAVVSGGKLQKTVNLATASGSKNFRLSVLSLKQIPESGNILAYIVVLEDLSVTTELRRTIQDIEYRLAQADLRFRQLTVQTRSVTWELDNNGVYTYISSNVSQEWGYRPEEIVGRMAFYDLFPEAEREILKDEGMYAIKSGKTLSGLENPIVTKDGRIRWMMTAGSPEHDEQGNVVGYKGVDTDITAYKEAEQQIRFLATHDHLTGLPGFSLAKERMSQALGLTRRRGDMLAIMIVNLDCFKSVNDKWGYDMGDRVLRTAAERMRNSLRATDTAARIGGDEFVIMASSLINRADAHKIAGKIEQAISQPMSISGETINIGASIGVALYPQDGEDVESLIKAADDAMYEVKVHRSGRRRA